MVKMMKAPANARREWVDFAKGAAILLVVYYHTSLYLGDIGVENTLGRIKVVFELFPMPVFFLVSASSGAGSPRGPSATSGAAGSTRCSGCT